VRRALDRLRDAPLNFDPAELRTGGWQHDARRQPLPPEAPGPPAPDGSWALARRLMRGYGFADPSLVRAYYDPDTPLEGRTMLLEVRFHGLRFRAGCRVDEVYDRTEDSGAQEQRVWGWRYRTLAGHFEQGEMHWEVRKSTETGEVEFGLRAQSRRARDPNPLMRIGFRLFGRREQLRFYDSTCERMRRLTAEALGPGPRGPAVRAVAQEVTARRVGADDAAHDELARNVEDPAG
jgi:uncharacterized protein (UPF0548 family)